MINILPGSVVERTPATFLRKITAQPAPSTGTGTDSTIRVITSVDVAYITFDVLKVPMTRSRYVELFGTLPSRDAGIVPTVDTSPVEPIVSGGVLSVAETILDELRVDEGWTQDTIGYNFTATLPAECFPKIDFSKYPSPEWQEVWFNITPTVGQIYRLGFVVKKFFSLADRHSGPETGTGTADL